MTVHRLAAWGFERLYHEFAGGYDTVAALVSAGTWPRWTLSILPEITAPVLELGCGTGHVHRALAEQGVVSLHMDRSAPMLRQARARTAHLPLRLIRADARAIPAPDAAFATVVATFPSGYIAAPQTLTEIQRVLRPGGRLVVLLAARMDRPDWYTRLVSLAYWLTGQRSNTTLPAALLARMCDAGLYASGTWKPIPGGSGLFITAVRR